MEITGRMVKCCNSGGCFKEQVSSANWHSPDVKYCEKHACPENGCKDERLGLDPNSFGNNLAPVCKKHLKGQKIFLIRVTNLSENRCVSRDCCYVYLKSELTTRAHSVLFFDKAEAQMVAVAFVNKYPNYKDHLVIEEHIF